MNVYRVYTYDDDEQRTIRVFSTRELAEAYVSTQVQTSYDSYHKHHTEALKKDTLRRQFRDDMRSIALERYGLDIDKVIYTWDERSRAYYEWRANLSFDAYVKNNFSLYQIEELKVEEALDNAGAIEK